MLERWSTLKIVSLRWFEGRKPFEDADPTLLRALEGRAVHTLLMPLDADLLEDHVPRLLVDTKIKVHRLLLEANNPIFQEADEMSCDLSSDRSKLHDIHIAELLEDFKDLAALSLHSFVFFIDNPGIFIDNPGSFPTHWPFCSQLTSLALQDCGRILWRAMQGLNLRRLELHQCKCVASVLQQHLAADCLCQAATDLATIAQHHSAITHLDVSRRRYEGNPGYPFTATTMPQLMPNLQHLVEFLQHLARLSSIELLGKVDAPGAPLRTLVHLSKITLRGCTLTSYRSLAALPRLRTLHLIRTCLSRYPSFVQLPQLVELTVLGCITYRRLDAGLWISAMHNSPQALPRSLTACSIAAQHEHHGRLITRGGS
ncbi:hypothetical protein WJX73_010161 [Symbiochloris irregularis]|uniref:Uncharacterized protein n=1 Tax=Symbiochloris irregularis TaxID=706552 RepID=A0AAW1NM13_9CHLO